VVAVDNLEKVEERGIGTVAGDNSQGSFFHRISTSESCPYRPPTTPLPRQRGCKREDHSWLRMISINYHGSCGLASINSGAEDAVAADGRKSNATMLFVQSFREADDGHSGPCCAMRLANLA
jgi:hypothetical protein